MLNHAGAFDAQPTGDIIRPHADGLSLFPDSPALPPAEIHGFDGDSQYFDNAMNAQLVRRIAERCYVP